MMMAPNQPTRDTDPTRAAERTARRRVRLGMILAVLAVLMADCGARYLRIAETGAAIDPVRVTDRVSLALRNWSQGVHNEDDSMIVMLVTAIPIVTLVIAVYCWFAAFPLIESISLLIYYVAFRKKHTRKSWLAGTYAVCNKAPIIFPTIGLVWWALM
jgi:hypothetical protein